MEELIPTELPVEESGPEDKINKVAEGTLNNISPPELERYKISFANYKKDKCSVDGMNGRNAQVATKLIRDIGLHFKNQELFLRSQSSSKIEIKAIVNIPPYHEYYKDLPSEIQDAQEVKEIKYIDIRPNKEADLRIFYYTLSNIFYMLAISCVHENLDHKSHYSQKKKKHFHY